MPLADSPFLGRRSSGAFDGFSKIAISEERFAGTGSLAKHGLLFRRRRMRGRLAPDSAKQSLAEKTSGAKFLPQPWITEGPASTCLRSNTSMSATKNGGGHHSPASRS